MRYLIVNIAVFGLLLGAPAAALAVECPAGQAEANGTAASDYPAGGGTGRCVSVSEWQSERTTAQQASEAQEKQEAGARAGKEAAHAQEQQREENKESGPPSTLHVSVVAVHGSTYASPGHSILYVSTNNYAQVYFKFTYPQHPNWEADSFHFTERLGKEANPLTHENDAAVDPWSCRAPMLVEDWEVQVKGVTNSVVESGPGLVQRGQIVDGVSKKWCVDAKKHERAAKLRRRERVSH